MLTLPCLFASILLTVVSQVAQKQVADAFRERSDTGPAVLFYLGQGRFWLALVSLGLAMVSWLVVLDGMAVGKAYPLLSSNYVVMLFVSKYVFREHVPANRWVGVTLIVAGLVLISAS